MDLYGCTKISEGNSVKSTPALLPKCSPYVSENGSPFISGYCNKPFATIEGARTTLSRMSALYFCCK